MAGLAVEQNAGQIHRAVDQKIARALDKLCALSDPGTYSDPSMRRLVRLRG
jgi:hypothetical protein